MRRFKNKKRDDARKLPVEDGGAEGADSRCFARINEGYAENNQAPNLSKRLRRVPEATNWGGYVHGRMGRTAAPPERTLSQILLTIILLQLFGK